MLVPETVPRVLVVDDDPFIVQFVAALGRRFMFAVIGASSIDAALEKAKASPPDAALIDLHIGHTAEGLDLPHQLRALPGLAGIPMAFLSGDASLESRVAAAKAGALVYVTKPAEPQALAAVVHNLIAIGKSPQAIVMLAMADADRTAELSSTLQAAGFTVAACHNANDIFARLAELRPDVVLLDTQFPPVGGEDTCRLLRTAPRWSELNIVLMADAQTAQQRTAISESGANDWLPRSAAAAELVAKMRAATDRSRRSRAHIERDPLTGLLLRRAFMDQVATKFDEARRNASRLSVCMLDIDHFKQVNDSYGHLTGDRVLARLGRLIQISLPTEDLRGRWGGEEFCLAHPHSGADLALPRVQRLLEDFRASALNDDHGNTFHASFSAGIASLPEDGDCVEALMRCADERLFQAKRSGRARVVSQ